ncbi:hypothetical protein [Rhizobium terrae]|uniref:hypothetical protein n=1 Tax=Rhizobium terrae TaxID=2171756 RepID=UPI000E3CA4DA|nr:hypothetical protein [Rhizobium terrae]
MGPNIVKALVFVGPLAGLALLMAKGERVDDDICPGNLALEKSREIVESRPGVVDIVWREFRWAAGCRVSMQGYADIETAKGIDRAPFEIVMAFDLSTHRWQEVSLDMPQ